MSRALVIAAACMLAGAGTARADPSDRTLVLTGLALAPPTYLLDVSMHEGSHAVAALISGADVDELHLFPPGVDPHAHVFRFGWTYVHGLHGEDSQLAFYLAPKLTDAVMIGGFAALAFTGAWPHNRYAELTLTVLATGWWIDFSKDVVLFARTNDVVKAFRIWDLTGWRQLPARLLYAGAAVGLGLIVAHGYERTFERSSTAMTLIAPTATALTLPVVVAAF